MVIPKMSSKNVASCVGSPTESTGERLFSRVMPLVAFQVLALVEGAITVGALHVVGADLASHCGRGGNPGGKPHSSSGGEKGSFPPLLHALPQKFAHIYFTELGGFLLCGGPQITSRRPSYHVRAEAAYIILRPCHVHMS